MELEKKVEQTPVVEGGEIFTDGYFVSVVFSNNRPYYFHTYDESITKNIHVVVDTVRGIELGKTSTDIKPISELQSELPLKSVLRVATEMDIKNYEENLELAKKAHEICKASIATFDLQMNLLKTEYTLDRTKVIFIYVSENRVDFRELLKDLAGKLKCRIELRQIGTRDRSKLVGGIGSCGMPLCCNSFLGEFDGISINMAKNQFLALNIQKLSGHCGKLICCLKYEDDMYTEIRKGLPKIGLKIKYEDAIYKITTINVLTSQVRLENADTIKIVPLKDVKKIVDKMRDQYEK